MNKLIKKGLRRYCPAIPVIRKVLMEQKIKQIEQCKLESAEQLPDDPDIEQKKEFVSEYLKCKKSYAEQVQKKLDDYLSLIKADKEEDISESKIDILFCCFAYGFMPDEYFVYELQNKTGKDRKSYISDRDRYLLVYRMNDIIDMDIYLDKFRTYQHFIQYYKRDAVGIRKKSDKTKFLDFIKKHPVFVQKNVSLSRGKSVALVDINNVKYEPEEYFRRLISEGEFILEERVVQSPAMSKLNPSSVNTVRCITFNTPDGVKIGPCFMKVGQGNSFIDNGGAGGILVGINNKTGVLNTDGYDEFLNQYKVHPDTKTIFQKYQLPEWDSLIALAKEISQITPSVKYIGWDFSHTEKGWIVIEGNASGQMIGPQIVWKKGMKEEICKLLEGVITL